MGQHTPIQWCDSAVNPVMGCDGCELWVPARETPDGVPIPAVEICYAGTLHKMRGGNPGYAKDFLQPETFAGRMAAAAKWSDLRGKARAEVRDDLTGKIVREAKPWLDGRPRHIFISDMGDALSASVPFAFLRDEVIDTAGGMLWTERGHVGMWLTKQPQRMAEFDDWLDGQLTPWPRALWAGTSITGRGQGARVRSLRKVRAAVRFLSVEPVLTDPGDLDLDGIHLVIIGGSSHGEVTNLDHLRAMIRRARAAKCAVFVKQLGRLPMEDTPVVGRRYKAGNVLALDDRMGGDWTEWPADLQIREFPEVRP